MYVESERLVMLTDLLVQGRYTNWNVRYVWWLTLLDAIGGGNRITYVMLWTLVADASSPQLRYDFRRFCSVFLVELVLNLILDRSSVFFTISSSLLLVQFLGMAISGFLLQTSPWSIGPIASLVYALNAPILMLSGLHSHLKCRIERAGGGNRQRLLDLDRDAVDAHSIDLGIEHPDIGGELKTSSLDGTFITNITAWLQTVHRQFFQHRIFQFSFLMHSLLIIALGTEIILQQWVSRAFSWTLANTTYTLAYTMFLSFIVLASLPAINARLHPRFKNAQAMDSNLVRWNLLIRSFGAFLLAFSYSPYLYMASITIYTLGVGLYESVKALLTSFAPSDQTTGLYTVIMMLEQIMNLASSLLWPRLLAATFANDDDDDDGKDDSAPAPTTTTLWKGFPFLLSSMCYLTAFFILIRICRSYLNP